MKSSIWFGLALAGTLALGVAAPPSLVAQSQGTTPHTSPSNPSRAEVVQMMKDISNWGRWGKDDEIGTFNLITPAVRKAAVALVKEGLSVSLAHTLDKEKLADNPTPFKQEFFVGANGKMSSTAAMDVISSTYHATTTTHMDSLCHYIFEGKTYNGWEIEKYHQATPTREGFGEGPGCMKNSILGFKNGLMTRGVLIDLPLMKGVKWLEPGTPVTIADLEAWEKFSGIRIGSGDALFLRTGRFARRKELGPWPSAQQSAGFHVSVMPWFKQRDVALISSDSVQDVQPSNIEGFPRPIHLLAINSLGMPMIDVADLEEVAPIAARLKRWTFLLTVTALPAPGGSGSPVNPTATF